MAPALLGQRRRGGGERRPASRSAGASPGQAAGKVQPAWLMMSALRGGSRAPCHSSEVRRCLAALLGRRGRAVGAEEYGAHVEVGRSLAGESCWQGTGGMVDDVRAERRPPREQSPMPLFGGLALPGSSAALARPPSAAVVHLLLVAQIPFLSPWSIATP